VTDDGFDDRDDRDDDGFDDRDDRDDDGFEWGTHEDEPGPDDSVDRGAWRADDGGGGANDRDDAFERTPPAAGTPDAQAAASDDDDAIRTADAGIDAAVAPWETGAGTGGFLRAFGEVVGVILVAIVAAFALTFVVGIAVFLAGFGIDSTPVLLAGLLGSQAGFVVAVLAFLRWRGEPLSNVGLAVPGLKGVVLAALGLVAALVVSLSASIAATVLELQPAQNATTSQAASDPTSLLLLIPFMILVVGPAEELLFRGIVQRRIRERASAPVAIVLGGALFASVHFVALVGDLSAIATTIGILLLPSLVFGALYEYGKNVVVNALVHGFYNSVLLLLSYAALRFAPEDAQPEGGAAVLDVLAVLL
jgi:membrane protease YdiL (CAAX protease family)